MSGTPTGRVEKHRPSESLQPGLLEVEGLSVVARFSGEDRAILSGVDFRVAAGEAIAIVGESGSGKSMTARAIMGLLPEGVRATGSVRLEGQELIGASGARLRRLRGREVSMIMQDPFTTLNPVMRIGAQVLEGVRDGSNHRLRGKAARAEAARRLLEIRIDDPDVVDKYPFELSGGMRQRVGIAAALAKDPRLLIADEPTTALDVTTQLDVLRSIKSLQRSRGVGLILITHDLRVAFSTCDRVFVLYAGSLLEAAPSEALEAEPLHPYTLNLLLAEPPLDRRLATMSGIRGSVPRPADVEGECAFAPRCRWATEKCRQGDPPMAMVEQERRTGCVRIDDLRTEMRGMRSALMVAETGLPDEQKEGQPIVRVEEARKIFPGGRGRGDKEALCGVSVEVWPGESVGIVGESGSGKTTLVRCLAGLERLTEGTIAIEGQALASVDRPTAGERRRLRETVQLVFQDPYSSLNPTRTIASTLRDAVALRGTRRRKEQDRVIANLLDRVGLPANYGSRVPIALSGGERQRVAIARALATEPRLLICDEPVSALDVSVQAQILALLRELSEGGISLLFITHDLAVVRQVVDRVCVMYRGEVVETGTVGSVIERPAHEYTRRLVASVLTGEALS
jgi:peptide/nickel transport system ATP-binding protein